MIDKLVLSVGKLPSTKKNTDIRLFQLRPNSYFSQVIGIQTVNIAGVQQVATYYGRPWNVRNSPQLHVNPRSFSSMMIMRHFLEQVGVTNNSRIKRIDFAADIECPLDHVIRSILIKRKRLRADFLRTRRTGIWIGAKPELIAIYDKARQLKSNKTLARIELRQWGAKATVKTFGEIESLTIHEPFKRIKFYKITTSPKRRSLKYDRLKNIIEHRSLLEAYFELNDSGNFFRDCAKWLREDLSFPDLDEVFQQQFRSFLSGGFHCEKTIL